MGLPIFVQAKAKVETRLLFQPRNVSTNLGRLQMQIIAIEVNALPIIAAVSGKARRVKAGVQNNFSVRRPVILPHQTQRSQRAGRFIAVDAGAEVNAKRGMRSAE